MRKCDQNCPAVVQFWHQGWQTGFGSTVGEPGGLDSATMDKYGTRCAGHQLFFRSERVPGTTAVSPPGPPSSGKQPPLCHRSALTSLFTFRLFTATATSLAVRRLTRLLSPSRSDPFQPRLCTTSATGPVPLLERTHKILDLTHYLLFLRLSSTRH
jgi:hypothetical protein